MRVEIRADHVVLDGYVTTTARDSRVLPSPRGRFVEQVEPGTFQRALERGKAIELRFNHGAVLGSTAEKTLELREDAIGLRATATVTDPAVVERARVGALRGWSFGFRKLRDRWEDWKEGVQRRYLEDIDLLEVSVLDKTPAYIATSIEERDGETCIWEERSIEDAPEVVETEREDPVETRGAGNIMADYKHRRLKLGGKKA